MARPGSGTRDAALAGRTKRAWRVARGRFRDHGGDAVVSCLGRADGPTARPSKRHLFDRAMGLFDLHPTVTLYDLSNTYFEGEAARQPKAKRGHSKDKRTDCPLLTLALVLDASGFVRRSRVFAGNVREHHTVADMLEALDAPPRGAGGNGPRNRHRGARAVAARAPLPVPGGQPRTHPAVRPRGRATHRNRLAARRAPSQGRIRGRPRGAPFLLLRGACRQGTRDRRSFRPALRDRADRAVRRIVAPAHPQTRRAGLGAYRSAQGEKTAASPSTTTSSSTPTPPANAPPRFASPAARSKAR